MKRRSQRWNQLENQASELNEARATLSRADSSLYILREKGAAEQAKAEQQQRQAEAQLTALHALKQLTGSAQAATILERFDSNRDGRITQAELQDGLRQLGEQLSDAEMAELMSFVDQDGSGAVEYGEYDDEDAWVPIGIG